MSPLPDPDEMVAAAGRIAGHARASRERAARLDAAAARVDWHGPAATAFYAQAYALVAGLRRCADRLDDAADALRRHAERIRDKLAHLLDLGPDLADIGRDVVHGAGDLITGHVPGLIGDSIAILDDTVDLGSDIVHVVRP